MTTPQQLLPTAAPPWDLTTRRLAPPPSPPRQPLSREILTVSDSGRHWVQISSGLSQFLHCGSRSSHHHLYVYILGVLEYIQEMREILHNLQNRIQKAKQNIDGISQAMKVSKRQGTERGLIRGPGEGPWVKGPRGEALKKGQRQRELAV